MSEQNPTSATLAEAPVSYDKQLERIEIELLLEGIFRQYGFDFRAYAYSSIRRRIWKRITAEHLENVSALQERVLHDPRMMERLLLDLSVNVTAMFRDPGFYAAFREEVIPLLRTYPFIRIWHAGCSTGEEVYSMAILLEEEGLYDRARIYATDISDAALRTRQRTEVVNHAREKSHLVMGFCQGWDELVGSRPALQEKFSV